MPSGPFFFKDPISLTLAADQRFAPLDAEIDAVWQLSLEPHKAMAMVTSFGLQAQNLASSPFFDQPSARLDNQRFLFSTTHRRDIFQLCQSGVHPCCRLSGPL